MRVRLPLPTFETLGYYRMSLRDKNDAQSQTNSEAKSLLRYVSYRQCSGRINGVSNALYRN